MNYIEFRNACDSFTKTRSHNYPYRSFKDYGKSFETFLIKCIPNSFPFLWRIYYALSSPSPMKKVWDHRLKIAPDILKLLKEEKSRALNKISELQLKLKKVSQYYQMSPDKALAVLEQKDIKYTPTKENAQESLLMYGRHEKLMFYGDIEYLQKYITLCLDKEIEFINSLK